MKRGAMRLAWGGGLGLLLVGALTFLATRTDPTQVGESRERVLIIATAQEPDTLDPTSTLNNTTVFPILGGSENRANVFESLVLTPANGAIVPNLAQAYSVLGAGRTIEFKLRADVKFHSGDAFTAEDVVFSQQRSVERSPQYKNSMRNVERVEAVDALTVRFHFSRPDATFFSRLGPIASKTYFQRVGEKEFVAKPNGTGPYKFSGRRLGQYLDMEAFDGYHDGPMPKAGIRRVRYAFAPDSAARIAMLRSGAADMITDTPYSIVKRMRALGFKNVQVPSLPTVVVQFSNRNPKAPWADVRVRRAIAHAIDADSIVAKALYGSPKRYAALAPTELGYDPTLKPYAYDPEQARRLLAEAGYPQGFAMPLYYWVGGYEGVKETAEAVTLNLLAVGIRAEVQGLDGVRIFELLRKVAADPTMEYVGVMPSPIAHTAEPSFALNNMFFGKSAMAPYDDPDLNKIVLSAAAQLDPQARAAEIARAYRLVHDDVIAIPLWAGMKTLTMTHDVDYTPASSETVRLVNASWNKQAATQ